MKRIMRFWTLLALLAMTACEHKELCYEHPHVGFVRVLFDWSQLPGANPECMYVRFFPEEGGRPVQYEFTGRDGGTVQLSPGNYRIICHNGDMERPMPAIRNNTTRSNSIRLRRACSLR